MPDPFFSEHHVELVGVAEPDHMVCNEEDNGQEGQGYKKHRYTSRTKTVTQRHMSTAEHTFINSGSSSRFISGKKKNSQKSFMSSSMDYLQEGAVAPSL